MAKRTAVIDLGSNSMRMAIFERTSRWAFFTLGEYKTKVRLACGGYSSGGIISPSSMQRALAGFAEFANIAKQHKCNKIYAIGTSALRDAPNSQELISKVKALYGINLRVIDGKMEAIYGATAAANLLAPFKSGVSIDIGGGSTELALIKDGKICKALSLDLGTVRLKELFFDNKNVSNLKTFLSESVKAIGDEFKCENVIAIGGSLRALSSAIMSKEQYALSTLHNFEYKLSSYEDFFSAIANSSVLDLDKFGIKKERFDTIREGVFIFLSVAKALGAKRVITSGVGVREGVFLSDFLTLFRGKKGDLLKDNNEINVRKFPHGLNPGLKSLLDRFRSEPCKYVQKYVVGIFNALAPLHKLDDSYLAMLLVCARLVNIGSNIGFYNDHKNSAYIILNSLNYGYTHSQKALIAATIGTNGKKNIYEYERLHKLLPNAGVIRWLSFMLYLSRALALGCPKGDLSFSYQAQTLSILGGRDLHIAKEETKRLSKPDIFAITFA